MEAFALASGRMEWTYTEVDTSGRATRDIKVGWDEESGSDEGNEPVPLDTHLDGIPDNVEVANGLAVEEDDALPDDDGNRLDNYGDFCRHPPA